MSFKSWEESLRSRADQQDFPLVFTRNSVLLMRSKEAFLCRKSTRSCHCSEWTEPLPLPPRYTATREQEVDIARLPSPAVVSFLFAGIDKHRKLLPLGTSVRSPLLPRRGSKLHVRTQANRADPLCQHASKRPWPRSRRDAPCCSPRVWQTDRRSPITCSCSC